MTSAVATPPDDRPRLDTGSRRADIQGLRAVAVLMVIVFHAGLPLPGGFVGVDVFFVISGFVITAMLMRERAAHGRIRFGHFYLRRFLRLTPALAVLVGVVAIASVLLQNPFGAQQTTARTGIGAMLLVANYVIGHASGDYFAAAATTNPLLHTWSLSVEEQFYLAFPALLALGWAVGRRRIPGPLLVVAVITAGSLALSLLWSYGSSLASGLTDAFGGAESFAYYSSLTRAWEFAVGAGLALALARLPVLGRAGATLTGLVGAVALVLSGLLITEADPFPGLVALLPVVGTALVVFAGSHVTAGVSRVLSTPPMVWIGDRSYSWYLWHWPVIVFAALLFPNRPAVLVVAAGLSLLPAMASYRLVEQPLRTLRPRSRTRAAAVVVPTVAVPVVLCAGLLVGATTGWGLAPPTPDASSPVAVSPGPVPTTSDEASAPDGGEVAAGDGEVTAGEGGSLRSQHAVVRAGCVNNGFQPEQCRFGPTDAVGTILLAGDSQAYALADGVIAAGERLGLQTIATSRTGCPFLARESSGVHNYPCRSWQKDIVAWALAERPEVVVIANRSGGYVRPGKDWRTVARDDGRRADSVDEAADLYRRGLEPVISALDEAGIPVLVVQAVPEMTGYTDQTSLLGDLLGTSAFEVEREAAERDRQPAVEVEQSLAGRYPRMALYDPIPVLCDDRVCSTERDGDPVYQDETHLSVPGALLLTDGLAEAIGRLAFAP